MSYVIEPVLTALVEYYGVGEVEELPFTKPSPGVWSFNMDDITVRLLDDDGQIKLFVFEGGRNLRPLAAQTFTDAPVKLIAQNVAYYLDQAIENM